MRSVLGGSVWGDAIFSGSVFDGVRLVWVDQSSVVMRSRWWCEIYGGAGAGVLATPRLGCDWWIGNSFFFLSLYLSLCTSNLEMV